MITSFDVQIHSDETIPCCPYCDQSLDIGGPIQDGMHAECNRQFGEELQEAFPDPIQMLIEPSDEVLPIEQELDILIEIDALLSRN
jgi:hypothetical protein